MLTDWQFIDCNTLRENKSGYEIHLDGGTWFHPLRLKPVASPQMRFTLQLKLLRSGLEHIKYIGDDRHSEKKSHKKLKLVAS